MLDEGQLLVDDSGAVYPVEQVKMILCALIIIKIKTKVLRYKVIEDLHWWHYCLVVRCMTCSLAARVCVLWNA